MEALANITSHSARINQIRKFVMEPPKRGVALRLLTAEDPPQTLGEWAREEASGNGALPQEINGLLVDHCTTVQRHTEAVLAWQAGEASGPVVSSKRLRVRYEPEDVEDFAEAEALGITGTSQGQVMQMQRHHEVMARSYMTAHQAQLGTALQLVQTMGNQLNEAYQRLGEMSRELDRRVESQRLDLLDRAEAEADQVVNAAQPEPTAESETDAAKAEIVRTVNQAVQGVLPMIVSGVMTKLFASMQSAPAPQAPPPQAPPPRAEH